MKLKVFCNACLAFETDDLKRAFEFAMEDAMPGDQYKVIYNVSLLAKSGDDMGQALDELLAHSDYIVLNHHAIEMAEDENGTFDGYLVDGTRYDFADDALRAVYGWDDEPEYWELGLLNASSIAKRLERWLKQDGIVELGGYWIYTANAIADEQKCWDDSDKAKHMDFSGSVYWVTTGDENGPLGFDSVEDAVRSVIER